MAPIRSSNLERGKWRSKCREELSKHIHDRVGISIEPSQVRLITRTDDPYTWKVLPEKRHLFSKNISDHSIGAYKELCEGVNNAFEAVPARIATGTGSTGNAKEFLVTAEPIQRSFSARIDELYGENVTLKRELKHWRDQAATESERQLQLKQNLKDLTIANQLLHHDLQKSTMLADRFRSDIYKYIHIVNGVMPLMDQLRAGLTLNEDCGVLEPLLSSPAVQSNA